MIKEIIYNYWDSELPKVIERDIKPELKTELIIDIVGVRRSGKTYLMFGLIKKITKRTGKKATLYINFENRKLLPLTPNYFNQVIDFIYQEKLLEKYKKIYLFFDEIQRIKNWERFIRSIYDEFKGKIKISGAKNSALPLLAASILSENGLILENVPNVADVRTSMEAAVNSGGRIGEVTGTYVIARPHLELENDRSNSFKAFLKGLCCLVETP